MYKEKKTIVIFTPEKARQLLRAGFEIVDIKPNKKDKLLTVFVFKCQLPIT